MPEYQPSPSLLDRKKKKKKVNKQELRASHDEQKWHPQCHSFSTEWWGQGLNRVRVYITLSPPRTILTKVDIILALH